MSRWAGRVAFVLAIAVGGGWAVSLVLSSNEVHNVTPEAASILSTIGGVLAGGIAAYLGNSSQQHRDPTSRTRTSDTPVTRSEQSAPDAGDAGVGSDLDTQ